VGRKLTWRLQVATAPPVEQNASKEVIMAKYSPEVWKNLLFANASSYMEQHNGNMLFASLFMLGTEKTKTAYLMEVGVLDASNAMGFFAMMASLLYLEDDDCEVHVDFMKDDAEMLELAKMMSEGYVPEDMDFSTADGARILGEVWLRKDGALKMLPYISGYIMNYL